jgi:hypothetical protein
MQAPDCHVGAAAESIEVLQPASPVTTWMPGTRPGMTLKAFRKSLNLAPLGTSPAMTGSKMETRPVCQLLVDWNSLQAGTSSNINKSAPPLAKFATSPPAAAPSGLPKAACNAAMLSKVKVAIR